jgi:flagellar hook protein FlgE
MSLSSSLFSGISGLTTLGNAMQIIGDNIANVNTVGFKSSSFAFQDLLSQSVATLSGTSQVGRGTALGDIQASFAQGSFESTGNTTDLAVGGDGFFVLNEQGTENLYYSRAGNFNFNESGYLTNPEGYVVQGWQLDNNGSDIGSITDIVMSSFTSPPQPSDNVEVIVNLDSDGENGSALDSLASAWDGTATIPLADAAYEYQTTIRAYDSLGSTHDVTLYFDKADASSSYEFIVTCNPAEDNRVIFGATGEAEGMLARGLLEFNSGSGVIENIDLFQFTGTGSGGDGIDLSAAGNWTEQFEASDLSNGYFTFSPGFLSGGTTQDIELDLGTRYDGTDWVNSSLSSTQYASGSTTTFQSANGYGAGDLEGVNVDVDGVITGSYSNGQRIPLYRVGLAKFQNTQGLFKEGGNLYSETRQSGSAITNKPGTNGLGSIAPNALEQSNVDIANELVKMITTQRGFQANSKIITVTDQMLSELINIKR